MSGPPAVRRFAGLLCLALLVLAGCTRTYPGVQPEELRIVARWIEDLTHGIPRRPGELELDGRSPDLRRIGDWLGGDAVGDRRVPPLQVRARIARWPAVAGGLRSGLLLIDAGSGLIGPSPKLAAPEFALAAEIADAENHDRRTIDAIVLARAQASTDATTWYADAVRQARLDLDAAAGGSRWIPPSP